MSNPPDKSHLVDLRDVVAILGILFTSIGCFLIYIPAGFISIGLPLLVMALAPEFRRRGESQ